MDQGTDDEGDLICFGNKKYKFPLGLPPPQALSRIITNLL